MEASSFIFSLALLILVVMFVIQPLISKPGNEITDDDSEMYSLMAEQERIMAAIKELEFDNRMGKVPEDLYPVQRDYLVRSGADVLRQMDVMNDEREQVALDESKPPTPKDILIMDDKIEEMIRLRINMRSLSSTKFCHNCGKSVAMNDKFCSTCGSSIN